MQMKKSSADKAPKVQKSKLDKVNLTKATLDAQKERATKYQYPADVTSKEDRKRFRRNARKTASELKAQLQEISGKKGDKKEQEKIQGAIAKFEKSTYKPKVEEKKEPVTA